MTNAVMQKSFAAGEWAPALNARVDLAKYHTAASLMRNFFVDYRGGASSCPGTKYILQALTSSKPVRLIPFQASFTVNYVLEFGDFYVRFYFNGAPVLEAPTAITGATQANPGVITDVAHGYSTGNVIFIQNVGGMTQLNGKYYLVVVTGANTYTLTDLNGVAVNTTTYGAYTAGGTASRVYTLPSPYAAADLALLKFTQNVNTLVITNTSYVPYVLTLISATNWTLIPIVFGSTLSAPTGLGVVSTSSGAYNFSYIVTAVDVNGQESSVPAPATITDNATGATNTVSWTAVSGAVSYNIYRTSPSTAAAVPTGAAFGFVTNVTGVSFADYIQANGVALNPSDFTQTIPITKNPFQGAGVASITQTAAGVYTVVPGVTLTAAPAGGHTATASAVLQVQGTPTVGLSNNGFVVGEAVLFPNGVIAIVATRTGSAVATFQPITFPGSNAGAISGAGTATPANPVTGTGQTGGALVTANFVWGVGHTDLVSAGDGYAAAPAVTYSAGAATATSTLSPSSAGNPAVPAYFDQRLVLSAKPKSVQTFDMSQPGSYYNFNISNPIQPDDAITGNIVSNQLNTIKSMLPMPTGLIVFGDRQAWLVNGGSGQTPITPIDATANAQAYNGASDVPPIVVNYDIIYVQAKGSYVRDLTFNFYTNIFTGTDISILSSHLFYGYKILEWAYAEEPFKLVWAVRNDGVLLSLTFVKEQELIGWAHRDTVGLFKSVCSIVETVTLTNGLTMTVDAVYVVVQRVINGNTVQYIERMAERIFPNGAKDAWCVDAGLQYNGAPATAFTGGDALAGATVTGLADGAVIPPFTMPVTGNFTLATPASKVTVGLPFVPQLQTLPLDLGEPTVQGKVKQIPSITVRVQDTLGISIGSRFASVVPMKDLVVGNVSSMLTGQAVQVVTDLVTGDAQTIIDATYTVQGQYCIQQNNPLPATILGVIPNITVGNK